MLAAPPSSGSTRVEEPPASPLVHLQLQRLPDSTMPQKEQFAAAGLLPHFLSCRDASEVSKLLSPTWGAAGPQDSAADGSTFTISHPAYLSLFY